MDKDIEKLAAGLIGTGSLPPGLDWMREHAREARAYHMLDPYPLYHFRDWKSEERGALPRCLPIAKSIVRRGARWLFGDPPINLLPCRPGDAGGVLRVAVAGLQVDVRAQRGAAGRDCLLGLRPETIAVHPAPQPNAAPAQILAATPLHERLVLGKAANGCIPKRARVIMQGAYRPIPTLIKAPSTKLIPTARPNFHPTSPMAVPPPGSHVWLSADARHALLFDAGSGARIEPLAPPREQAA